MMYFFYFINWSINYFSLTSSIIYVIIIWFKSFDEGYIKPLEVVTFPSNGFIYPNKVLQL